MTQLEERKAALLKPLWTNTDIMKMCGVGLNVASRIRNRAIKDFNGACLEDSRKVKKSAVLKYLKSRTN